MSTVLEIPGTGVDEGHEGKPHMRRPPGTLTGVERKFGDDEFIVSKTDVKGKILYANRLFIDIAGYTESELIGAPQSIVRHPGMPRSVFKLMWETILGGREFFGYVVNRCKNGDHYWVFAHVTPSMDESDNLIGFHSNRRNPDRRKLGQFQTLYQTLVQVESQHHNPKDQIAASYPVLQKYLAEIGKPYEEFVLTP